MGGTYPNRFRVVGPSGGGSGRLSSPLPPNRPRRTGRARGGGRVSDYIPSLGAIPAIGNTPVPVRVPNLPFLHWPPAPAADAASRAAVAAGRLARAAHPIGRAVDVADDVLSAVARADWLGAQHRFFFPGNPSQCFAGPPTHQGFYIIGGLPPLICVAGQVLQNRDPYGASVPAQTRGYYLFHQYGLNALQQPVGEVHSVVDLGTVAAVYPVASPVGRYEAGPVPEPPPKPWVRRKPPGGKPEIKVRAIPAVLSFVRNFVTEGMDGIDGLAEGLTGADKAAYNKAKTPQDKIPIFVDAVVAGRIDVPKAIVGWAKQEAVDQIVGRLNAKAGKIKPITRPNSPVGIGYGPAF